MTVMLSIIVAADGQDRPAVATLAALVPGAAAGLVREVILVDRESSAAIARVADVAGCAYLATRGSRAEAFAAGAAQARSAWLMFIHAGAVLEPGWLDETAQFIQLAGADGRPRAGVFRFARSPYARRSWRDSLHGFVRLFGGVLPDQGLVIAREHYERTGGYRVAQSERQLLRQLGRSSRLLLQSRIVVA